LSGKRGLPLPQTAAARRRRDIRAEKLISQFADKLLKLSGGRVPDAWREQTNYLLKMVWLSNLMGGEKAPRPRGRPRMWPVENNLDLVNMIDSIKGELTQSKSRPVSDKEAIRRWIKLANPLALEWQLKREVDKVAKLLSRARPPQLRRAKRKSQKSR
jgi:hypothetical protein